MMVQMCEGISEGLRGELTNHFTHKEHVNWLFSIIKSETACFLNWQLLVPLVCPRKHCYLSPCNTVDKIH